MGAITFDYLEPGFTVPRAYLDLVTVRGDFLSLPQWVGNTIHFVSAAGYIYDIKMSDGFYPWSTKAYSLDYIFDPSGSSIDCVLFPCHDVVDVFFRTDINNGKRTVELHPLALGSTRHNLTLPPPPPDYWGVNPAES